MGNNFDKKAFDKSQNKLLLTCLTVGLIGVITIICAFVVGKGIKFNSPNPNYGVGISSIADDDDFGKDPRDYYGDYYAVKDFAIIKLSISDSGITETVSDIFKSETKQYFAQYASEEYCYEKFGTKASMLILYQNSVSIYSGIVQIDKVNGNFVLIDGNITYTQTPITLESLHNDPKYYYGTYYNGDTAVITTVDINKDSAKITETDPLTNQSDSITYQYKFICGEYSNILTQKAYNALVLYTKDINEGQYVLWMQKDGSGAYTLFDTDNLQYTTDVITADSTSSDPKDYYGVYYGEGQNFEILKLNITSNKLQITLQNPMKNDITEEFLYSYISAEYALRFYDKNSPALVAYKQTVDEPSYIFYLSKHTNGKYSISSTQGVDYTINSITFADLMDDPKDYYGVYKLNDDNTLELFENGIATLVFNGETKNYYFFYANENWLDLQNINYSPAIVLSDKSSSSFYAFKIDNSGNLILSNQYTFYKS